MTFHLIQQHSQFDWRKTDVAAATVWNEHSETSWSICYPTVKWMHVTVKQIVATNQRVADSDTNQVSAKDPTTK